MTVICVGARFGRLIVVSALAKRNFGCVVWRCVCDCGASTDVSSHRLRVGKTRSCGCLWLEKSREAHLIHGMARKGMVSREWRIWSGMMKRCYNKNFIFYNRYGGRGIRVCKRWHVSENFLKDMGLCPKAKSIERKDNNKGYSPSNCRWATSAEQARNRSSTRMIKFQGKRMCAADWADSVGLSRETVRMRLHRGWSIKRVLGKSRRISR